MTPPLPPKPPMNLMERFYPESRFGGFTDADGTLAFFHRVNALLLPSHVVLDVGCGRGEYAEDPVPFRRDLRILKGKVRQVVGLDVDETARSNPFLDEFRRLQGAAWPVETASADMILCDHVLEHVADPDAFFGEIRRALKPGGLLCFRTPNRWGYVALLARLVPNRLHARTLAFAQSARKSEDVFPTLYRCNSLPRLRRLFQDHDLSGVVYGFEAEPAYLSFSRWAYACGVLHRKWAWNAIRPVLFGFAERVDPSPDRRGPC